MSDQPSFNLVAQPWIRVQRLDGTTAVVSLSELFEQAGQIKQILGDLPTQTFAINRLLLAIVYRSVLVDATAWAQWWTGQRLPIEEIRDYLEAWKARFDLLDPERPFYQVADLHTAKGEFTELARLIGDAPVGHPFLTTKLGESLESISLPEAARWVVHCQSFDVSGIKSGAVGDPRVKSGKGYPIGVGYTGKIGGLLIEGDNQLQTLLLNLVGQHSDDIAEDYAAWELDEYHGPATPAGRFGPEPLRVANTKDPYRPRHRVEALTWQSRRIRLATLGDRVTAVLITNGDPYSPLNLHQVEMMTAWRESPTQAKTFGLATAYMPRSHPSGRALWRGIEGLLVQAADSTPEPGTMDWIQRRTTEGVIASDFLPRVRAIGIEYINQASIVGEIVDDELAIPVRVLDEAREDLRATVISAVQKADHAVREYVSLRVNLVRAAGGETDIGDQARSTAFALLDRPFRVWLSDLRHPDIGPLEASDRWASVVRHELSRAGENAVIAAGPAAWVGRIVNGRHVDAARADMWFRQALLKLFPQIDAPKEESV